MSTKTRRLPVIYKTSLPLPRPSTVKLAARCAAIDGLGRGKELANMTGRQNTVKDDEPSRSGGQNAPTRNPEEAEIIVPRVGTTFTMRTGQVCLMIDAKGKQIADYICFTLQDYVDKLSPENTELLNGTLFLTTGTCTPRRPRSS